MSRLEWLIHHPAAPRWSTVLSDQLLKEDDVWIEQFRESHQQLVQSPSKLPLQVWREELPFREELWRDWSRIPTSSRQDLVERLVEFVPKSADFSRLIYYDTSGTSAPPLRLPYHPRTVALNHTLAEKALGWYGIAFKRGPEHAIVQLCRQAETWVYPTSYSIWQGALGAKLNLNERHWSQDSARKLLADLKPWLITGTPQSLAEAMAWKLPLKPEAILCGASSLSTALKQQFQQYFACPVLDWYSTTESGPIAATAPDGLLKMLAPDLLVEVLDEKSQPAAQGELVISGGRNPYLPLIRYRTGDTGSFSADTLTQFSARQPVQYQASDGSPVSSVDISRILYQYRWSAACFDGHMITIEPVPGQNFSIEPLLQKLSSLLARPVQGKTSMLFCKGIRWLPESESPKQ